MVYPRELWSFVWAEVQKGIPFEEIIGQVQRKYHLDRKTAEARIENAFKFSVLGPKKEIWEGTTRGNGLGTWTHFEKIRAFHVKH
jgi:hypothetical protein